MTLFVYVTETCLENARTHSLVDEVQKFGERLESTQNMRLFDPFPPPWFCKKKLGGRQGRLVAELRQVGEHAVIVFLTLMIRGSRDYEEFIHDPQVYGTNHFTGAVSQDVLEAYVTKRTAVPAPHAKPEPSPIEYALLYNAFAHRDHSSSDVIVCETGQWVDLVTQDRISKQLSALCAPCVRALELAPGLHYVAVPGKSGWGIWALKRDDRLLLLTPSTDATAPEAEEFAHRTAAALEHADAGALLRSSRRAYPAIVLADDDLWIDLEREPVANIALSPEESEVLESARRSSHPFPLFINGRAGSGKSTILQYLFADLLYTYLSTEDAQAVASPIFLTANGELLRIARRFVEQLLRSEAVFAQRAVELDAGNGQVLNDAFREFYAYLLGCMPARERKERFARANRVDYARFRKFWGERFGKDRAALRDYGPEICWHVIRSYIKGMSSEGFLEPEEYTQLPENQLTVSDATYRLIYEKVWPWYQELVAGRGLWDDQDLTRYVLDNHYARAIHPAVFCDEAQDFTRLELEFLLRINLFSERTLRPMDLGRVCFAFAGDQFQTLNPTGFRWDTIKSTFVEKFIFELDPSRRSERPDLNYQQLRFNYRSTDRIVRFGNHVQALRAALFGLPDLKPQTPWTHNQRAFQVSWFRATDASFWSKFRENPGIVVIVPCHEGEEAAFVQSDPILSQHIRVEDGVPLNVLSASRAKGCEYPIVVAYGFGQVSEIDVMQRLAEDGGADSGEQSLSLQYFVNRLYVAVSRPKRRLIVVDTDEGLERLWKSTMDEQAEMQLLRRLKKADEVWVGAIEGMIAGTSADLGRDAAVDPLETARAFEHEGITRSDPFLMTQAAQVYRALGDAAKARECRARSLEYAGDFLQAGEVYVEAGMTAPDGIRCLWQAGAEGRKALASLPKSQPQVGSEIEVRAAQLLQVTPTAAATLEFLGQLVARLDDPVFLDQSAGTRTWREVLSLLLKVVATDAKVFSPAEWKRLTAQLTRITDAGMAVAPIDAAPIYYFAGQYADAAKLWEAGGSTRSAEYMRAKASSEPYPQRLLSLGNLKQWPEVIQAYETSPNVSLSMEQATVVADAYRYLGNFEQAYDVGWRYQCPTALSNIAFHQYTSSPDLARRALHAHVYALVAQNQWDTLLTLTHLAGVSAGSIDGLSEAEARAGIAWVVGQREMVEATIIRAVARPNALADAPDAQRRRIQDFLRERLRAKDGHWRVWLTPEEAGAALERAGRHVDAAVFYEGLRGAKRSEEEVDFARKRWLVVKNRQLNYEQGAGKRRAIEREIAQQAAGIKIRSIEDLDEYPQAAAIDNPVPERPTTRPTSVVEVPPAPVAVSPASTVSPTVVNAPRSATSPAMPAPGADNAPLVPWSSLVVPVGALPDRFEVTLGNFALVLARSVGRLNITNLQTLENAHVKIHAGQCAGETEFEQEGTDGRAWLSRAWQLRIVVSRDPTTGVIVEFPALGASLALSLGAPEQ